MSRQFSPALAALKLSALLSLSVFALACSPSPSEEVSEGAVKAEESVLVSDLIASERSDGAAPESAHEISISQTRIDVGGSRVFDLEGRLLPKSARGGGELPLLREYLLAEPGREGAILKVHANASIGALARVLATLEAAEIAPVHFAVRKDRSGGTGYLTPASIRTVAEGEAIPREGAAFRREWSELAANAAEMRDGCEGRGSVNCMGLKDGEGEGGITEIELFTQQDAMRIRFVQIGGVRPANARVRVRDAQREPQPGELEFLWRREAAHFEGSPIGVSMRPLCAAERCGVIMRAHATDLAGSALRLLGSAFPNGTLAPEVIFIIPSGS